MNNAYVVLAEKSPALYKNGSIYIPTSNQQIKTISRKISAQSFQGLIVVDIFIKSHSDISVTRIYIFYIDWWISAIDLSTINFKRIVFERGN